ncbi:TIR domain-containing protein [Cytophaga aurantiaca]|uniref:TIR domain-containing protein n=1 Tax=Cytophaga aurantiaca TaxID=29530 RepID=UPI00037A2D0B|nr:TIR domain-containing protein [Cytophaga aurantiaca]
MNQKVFISYSHEDKKFVEWLKNNLKDLGLDIWFDQQEINLGDSIKNKITTGIQSSSTFIVVLSNSSKNSSWVKYELNSALLLNAINKGVKIIPIKIDDSEVPSDLAGYLYADFSTNREQGLELLKKTLLQENKVDFEFQDWFEFSPQKFEDLTYDLLKLEGFNLQRTPPIRDGGYDFIAKTTNVLGVEEKIIIESKFYKSKISIDLLRKLYAVALVEKVNKVLLITSSELTNSSREFIMNSAPNITVWEGHQLIQKLFLYPDLVEKYFTKSTPIRKKSLKLIDKELAKIQVLIKRLDECPEGKPGWKTYEDICLDILNYLFVPPLGKPRIQSRRESGIDIRDAIFPNRNSNENWKFIRDDYDAKYIVFEFKNYSENGNEIDKQVLLQVDDYLKKTIGRFGIVCSKKAPNRSGLEKRKDIFIEKNKLILFLSNEDLKEMLLRKHKKIDPSDVIIDLIDDFNLKF